MKKLTKAELHHITWALRSMIKWGEGGCFIKDDSPTNEVDMRAIRVAERALRKLEVLETLAK